MDVGKVLRGMVTGMSRKYKARAPEKDGHVVVLKTLKIIEDNYFFTGMTGERYRHFRGSKGRCAVDVGTGSVRGRDRGTRGTEIWV